MTIRMRVRFTAVVLSLTAVCVGGRVEPVRAQVNSARPITAENFKQSAPRGFGDRNNSWAQAMVWWRGALYVGTGRQALCTSLYAVWQYAGLVAGWSFADTWFPYPPANPDLSCAPDGADLSIQAEIWRWTPGNDAWQRVYQSPLELDNPGPGAPYPPRVGKKVPYEITIRGMAPHVEPDGTEALYAFGVNSTIMWDRSKLPPPRILRSTDGITFTPIPQTPGTFLGDLPFNPDHSSFRSAVSYGGKLFTLSGPVFGQGSLIASADPARGDDAWFLASPPGRLFYELAVFNGWLYVGGFDTAGGYSVLKTRAEGPPPYEFVTVVPGGAYLTERPSKSVVSMRPYDGRLYVGTATFTEVIRINPDDTWELVVGSPRRVPAPGGGSEWMYPISGLDAGFGYTLNDHAWQMDDPFRYLYIGTYNASIASKHDPVYGPLLQHNMGAHLYRTPDGWYYSAITTNGFAAPDDPYGGPFDYGIRTMETTPHGMFLGTANDYYGLAIFRASTRGSAAPDPPLRVNAETTTSGAPLLSWERSPRAASYQVWRAEILPIFIRDDANFEAWNGASGNKVPDTYLTPYERVGVTPRTAFIDTTVQPGKKYLYYVLVDAPPGLTSDQSNLVQFPLLTPAVTFASVLDQVDRLEQRQRFRDPANRLAAVRDQLTQARTFAAECRIPDALHTLNPKKASNAVLEPDSIDIEILISKLERRLANAQKFPGQVSWAELCTGS